ncbi:hypothetical protein Q0O08_32045, partial [Bacillus thuringiensis]
LVIILVNPSFLEIVSVTIIFPGKRIFLCIHFWIFMSFATPSLRTEKKTGYVVTLDLSKEERKQIWYGLNDLAHFLRSSRLSLEDVYVSLNDFPSRES